MFLFFKNQKKEKQSNKKETKTRIFFLNSKNKKERKTILQKKEGKTTFLEFWNLKIEKNSFCLLLIFFSFHFFFWVYLQFLLIYSSIFFFFFLLFLTFFFFFAFPLVSWTQNQKNKTRKRVKGIPGMTCIIKLPITKKKKKERRKRVKGISGLMCIIKWWCNKQW